MSIHLSRDALRQGVVDSAQGMRGSMFSSSIDGRTNNIIPNDTPTTASVYYPLEVSYNGTAIVVEPGTVLGEMPTLDADRLDTSPAPMLDMPNSGTQYVVINVDMEFSIYGGVYTVPALDTTSVEITVETEDPTSAGLSSSDGTYKILLATYVDGVKTLQNGFGPIGGEICDTLQGTHTAQLIPTYVYYGN